MTSTGQTPSLLRVGQTFTKEIRQAIVVLQGCVTPILNINEKREAKLLGSAVLIEMVGNVYLCTAKHVIDENATSDLYIDGPSELEPLVGDFYVSGGGHDMAVLKLSPEQVTLLQKYSPLTIDHIGNHTQASICKYVEFIGFPATKNPTIYQLKKIKGLLHANGCTVIEINPTRVRVNFNRKKNIDANTRQRVTAPDPHGMSGGAMFGVPVNSDTIKGKPQPKLIGISTDVPNPNEVFGTNIAVVMAIIRDAYTVAIPSRLNPVHISTTTTSITRVTANN